VTCLTPAVQKAAEPIQMQFGMLNWVGPGNMHYMGCRCPHGKGHFLGCLADWKAL